MTERDDWIYNYYQFLTLYIHEASDGHVFHQWHHRLGAYSILRNCLAIACHSSGVIGQEMSSSLYSSTIAWHTCGNNKGTVLMATLKSYWSDARCLFKTGFKWFSVSCVPLRDSPSNSSEQFIKYVLWNLIIHAQLSHEVIILTISFCWKPWMHPAKSCLSCLFFLLIILSMTRTWQSRNWSCPSTTNIRAVGSCMNDSGGWAMQ